MIIQSQEATLSDLIEISKIYSEINFEKIQNSPESRRDGCWNALNWQPKVIPETKLSVVAIWQSS
jgi:hypothetical protein